MPFNIPSKLTGHTDQSEIGEQVGSSSSGCDPAAVSLPTEEAVRTWDSEDLYKWLTSITPPPLSRDEQTAQAFLNTGVDGPVFLDWGNKLFSDDLAQVIPLGVAKRLNMLANSIKDNTLRISASRKRAASSSSIRCPKVKKKSSALGSDTSVPVPQAPSITLTKEGSPQLVEELEIEVNHVAVHRLVGMSFASREFFCYFSHIQWGMAGPRVLQFGDIF